MPVKYIGKARGFSQRTFTHSHATPYLSMIPHDDDLQRSGITQQRIVADLMCYSNDTPRFTDPTLKLAINHTYQAFRLPEPVKMVHLCDVFRDKTLPIWSRSPGLPWKNLGYRTKGDVRDDHHAQNKIRKFWHFVKTDEMKMAAPDCCAFVRSHLSDKDVPKIRAVWGYPATITFGEAVFALPLIRAYARKQDPIAYGFELMNGGALRTIDRMRTGGKWINCLDFKSFDKTVPSWLIDIAFDILATNIDFLHYEGYGTAVVTSTYRMYEYIKDYFINTKIRTAKGLRFQKSSGVASGSYFTQLVDSIINHLVITYTTLRLVKERPMGLLVMGDDSIFTTTVRMSKYDIQCCFDMFGLLLNPAKSTITTEINDATFLGYTLNFGRPSKPYKEWIAALLFPDRPDESYDDVASRALGLCYANSGVNSDFHFLCETICKLQPYDLRLPRNLEKFLNIQGIVDVKKEIPSPIDFMRRLQLF